MIREAGKEPRTDLTEIAGVLRENRDALSDLEGAVLSGIAASLVEAADRMVELVDRQEKSRPADWIDAEQMAARLGITKDAFQKVTAKTDLPRHHLTEKKPLYNVHEVDEWLMNR